MAHKKMGATDTDTILWIGGGLLLAYLVMRKPAAPPPVVRPPITIAPGTTLPATTSPTNTAITAGASVINNLINQIFG